MYPPAEDTMNTKLEKVLFYSDRLLPSLKPHDPLTHDQQEVTWQFEKLKFPLSQLLIWPVNLAALSYVSRFSTQTQTSSSPSRQYFWTDGRKFFLICLMDCYCRSLWPAPLDALEKRYVRNVDSIPKLCVGKNDMP